MPIETQKLGPMPKKPVILAVCGKGGVGKTSVSALIVRLLSENPAHRILAIDADPAVGLSFPLGITVQKTVDDIRNELITRLEAGETTDRKELVRSLVYELFNALEERENIAFLAIGRPEGDGCYCSVNALLKDIIREIAVNFDYVIIDAEAGIEQINRRVMEMVTHLLLVSDASLKARTIVETIHRVAQKKCALEKSGVIFNKMRDQQEINSMGSITGLETWGALLENDRLREFDREGRSFFQFPDQDILHQLDAAMKVFLS
ncbi:MAG: AAA family ATPase [Desulfobacterales bacterium]|nr:AAA family ATPase [Desulfobacterales bacterium]